MIEVSAAQEVGLTGEDFLRDAGALSGGVGLMVLAFCFAGAFIYFGWMCHPQVRRQALSWSMDVGAKAAAYVALILFSIYAVDYWGQEDGWAIAIGTGLFLLIIFFIYPRLIRWVKKEPEQ